jgi:hypothetical protein
MYGDVVVIPADGDQVVRVGETSPAPRDDVMHLEPASAAATVDDTSVAVSPDDGPPQKGRDGSGSSSVTHWLTVITEHGDVDDGVTQDGP